MRRWQLGIVIAAAGLGPACDATAPAAAARTLAIAGGAGQVGTVGQDVAVPYQVRVTDSSGAPLGAIAVTWTVTVGGGSLSARDLVTDAGGVARATHRLGLAAGPQTVRAQVTNAAGSPVTFTTLAFADAPAQVSIVTGDHQSASAGQSLPTPYTVQVRDQFGNPTSAVRVEFSARGGSITPAVDSTDASGVASAVHTLGTVAGADSGFAVVPATGDTLVFVSYAIGVIPLAGQVAIPANYGLHDTFVRDGIAFACAWNTGVIIFDVGDGRAGGTPAVPIPIATIATAGGQAHNAWWFHNPVTLERRYLFVGEEGPGSVGTSASGDIHVVDVSDLANPAEVAFFRINGAGAHNFWMDEAAQVLYAAFYNGGVVALDVSGTLSGDLASREIARIQPGGAAGTYTWGVMQHRGSLYAVDMLTGVWQLSHVGPSLSVVSGGNNVLDRFSSDFWAHGDYAYSGTWQTRGGNPGNTVKIWRLGATGAPTLVNSLLTAGINTVSDVQVSSDGRLLVFSAEGGAGAGLYIYSLDNPANPTPLARATGVSLHTATVADVNGRRYVFAARNPASPAMMVFDITSFAP